MKLELGDIHEDPRGKSREVPMKVLCLGMGRNGTESLCMALTTLGIPTYHGWHTIANPRHNLLWYDAALCKYRGRGRLWTREDYDQMLGRHSACTDNPAAMFAFELINAYPEAKVILNRRPVEEWWKSWVANILPIKDSWSFWLLAHFDLHCYQTFVLWHRMQDFFWRGDMRRNGRRIYEEHSALIRGAVAKERLLEWQPQDGWEPLCKFLDLAVPREDFPHANQAEEFRRTVNGFFEPRLRKAMRNLILLGSLVAAVLAYIIWQAF